ncbi:MAG: bifunctional folylpolyglutamate synthase/dihydrofolate synthase, partial [Hyphomicrobiales bacterium]
FAGLAEWTGTVPVPGSVARFTPQALARTAAAAGLRAEPLSGVEAAVTRSRALSAGPVRLLVCGSLYLAGEVLASYERAALATGK